MVLITQYDDIFIFKEVINTTISTSCCFGLLYSQDPVHITSRRQVALRMETKISKKEATDFLESCGVMDPMKIYSTDKFKLLTEILKAFFEAVPFQSLTLLSKDKNDRRVPTEEEIKLDGLSKRGGICFTLNLFMHALLEAVGYDVDFTLGFAGDTEPAHSVVLVKNLTGNNSLHVVDVGLGFPHFEPVALDFDHESRVYHHSFHTFKYTKEANKFMRFHFHSKNDISGPYEPTPQVREAKGNWAMYYSFQHNPCNYGDDKVRNSAATIYNWPSNVHLHSVLRMVKWRNGKAIGIKGSTLLLENDLGKLDAFEMSSTDEIKKTIVEYFPGYSTDEIDLALQNADLCR